MRQVQPSPKASAQRGGWRAPAAGALPPPQTQAGGCGLGQPCHALWLPTKAIQATCLCIQPRDATALFLCQAPSCWGQGLCQAVLSTGTGRVPGYMGSIPRPSCTCRGPSRHRGCATRISLPHSYRGEVAGSQAAALWLWGQGGEGPALVHLHPDADLQSVQGCEASRGGQRSQPDSRNQAYKVSSQKVSEGPSSVRREHPHEERARALETRGEGSRGQSPGGPPTRPHRPGFTLSPDCDRSSGMPWTIPILCCGVTRPFHNQLPVTESWWQGHFHLPVTLAEMGMVWSWRGKRRQSQLSGRGDLGVGWGVGRGRRGYRPHVQEFRPLSR